MARRLGRMARRLGMAPSCWMGRVARRMGMASAYRPGRLGMASAALRLLWCAGGLGRLGMAARLGMASPALRLRRLARWRLGMARRRLGMATRVAPLVARRAD